MRYGVDAVDATPHLWIAAGVVVLIIAVKICQWHGRRQEADASRKMKE